MRRPINRRKSIQIRGNAPKTGGTAPEFDGASVQSGGTICENGGAAFNFGAAILKTGAVLQKFRGRPDATGERDFESGGVFFKTGGKGGHKVYGKQRRIRVALG